MSTDIAPPEFHLHFEGEATRGHTIPAAALVQTIQALQRSVQLLAMAYEGQELKQRLRVSHNMERKYAVIFGVPKDGGYDLSYHIGDTALQLFDPQDIQQVTDQHRAVLVAVQTGNNPALRRILPSAHIRRQVVNELKKLQPRSRTGLVVSIEDYRGEKLLDGRTASEKLAPMLAEPTSALHPCLVAGRLDALEFPTRTLRMRLPNGRSLSGVYGEDYEPVLLENPREWIQVRGEAVLDEDGKLKAINNITDIIEVDASPVTIDVLTVDGRTYNARKDVSFEVEFEPEDGVYTATGDFHMIVAADTRAELESSVNEALAFFWREYVDAAPDTMTADALDLRARLTAAFSGVGDAA